MTLEDERDAEIAGNYDYLMRNLARFMPEHHRQYALLKDRNVLGFYDDPLDASIAGQSIPGNGHYSIQEVTDEPIFPGVYALY